MGERDGERVKKKEEKVGKWGGKEESRYYQ
jgi:hypothetical protein